MRAALYARYSDEDLQSVTSVIDQLAALRKAAAARGWTIVGTYTDEGISGAATGNRPGVRALMAHAMAGGVDVVFAEALDRISRGQADTARLFELLDYRGVAIETLGSGHITELHVGLEGTMNRLFLVELGKKVRRGLIGRVNAGLSGGGHCYGYDIVGKGLYAINPDQAEVVRRIYADYIAGAAPRVIARALNADGVPGPRGGTWTPSTVAGDRRAGDGILCQELYIGVRVFNRRRYRKHPETGRRTSVLNPADQWVRQPAPALRILDDASWAAARARAGAISAAPRTLSRQPKRLLSGLLRCAVCGGAMWLQAGRYACGANRDRGGTACTNGKIIKAETVEARVLEGVRDRLLDPEAIEAAVRAYHVEMEAEHADAVARRQPLERELAEIKRRFDRLCDNYERGALEAAEFDERATPLKARRAELKATLDLAAAPPPVRLHPRAADYYRALTRDMIAAIAAPDGEAARMLIREVIERVDFEPLAGLGNFHLNVHGKLAALLGVSERAAASPSNYEVRLGAGTRSGRNLTALSVSFAA